MAARMHDDEVPTDADLVRRLLVEQFPAWAHLPVDRVSSTGTDYAVYRLGTDLAVRLPRIAWAVDQVRRDADWLPRIGPLLPVAVPEPVAVGEPGCGYPWPWAVHLVGPRSEPRARRGRRSPRAGRRSGRAHHRLPAASTCPAVVPHAEDSRWSPRTRRRVGRWRP